MPCLLPVLDISLASRCRLQVENIDLFGWELTDAEMDLLSKAASPPVAGDSDGSSGDCKVL